MSINIEAIDRENRMSIILDMMERHCPVLMKAGGGGLRAEILASGIRITKEQITQIRTLYLKNKSPKEIAQATGLSLPTVWRRTRNLR